MICVVRLMVRARLPLGVRILTVYLSAYLYSFSILVSEPDVLLCPIKRVAVRSVLVKLSQL
jgi:hypothetical protein